MWSAVGVGFTLSFWVDDSFQDGLEDWALFFLRLLRKRLMIK